MDDRQFLMWIHARLTEVHGESKFVDYMHRLREIIANTPKGEIESGVVTMDSMVVLDEIEKLYDVGGNVKNEAKKD